MCGRRPCVAPMWHNEWRRARTSAACLRLVFGDHATAYETIAAIIGDAMVTDGDGVKFGRLRVDYRALLRPKTIRARWKLAGEHRQ